MFILFIITIVYIWEIKKRLIIYMIYYIYVICIS